VKLVWSAFALSDRDDTASAPATMKAELLSAGDHAMTVTSHVQLS
jgi:hypothetical protein